MIEEDAAPSCNITIVGELIVDKPIRDSGAQSGDLLVLVGEPIWGTQKQRLEKAKNIFRTWFEIIHNIRINAAKDVTKGGLIATLQEISEKSGVGFKLEEEIPFPMTRNLDNFLVSISPDDYTTLETICKKEKCWIAKIGDVR